MLAARIRAGSKSIVLMNPLVAARLGACAGSSNSTSRSGWLCFRGIYTSPISISWSRADLGGQDQGNLVGSRTIQVTVLGINGRHALHVFARLRECDQLDELVGRVLGVLLAP